MENFFKITQESINKVNYIIENMDGNSFHNHYHILYDICNSFNKKISYVEIGAFAGGSASLVSLNKNVKNIISIDIGKPMPKEIAIKNVNKFKHNDCSYEYIEGDSKNLTTINHLKNKLNGIDILFIDGDHSLDGVIKDFENYHSLVNSGGFIVFDDYMDEKYSPEVFTAVNSIVQNLNENDFYIIGSLNYPELKNTNVSLNSSNEFILIKK